MASSVLYELIGPACAKLSLSLSHSYDKNVKDEKQLTPQEEDKLIVNFLIERIREIQKEIPEHSQPVTVESINSGMQGLRTNTHHLHSNNTNYH